jgi:DNA repair exonuclease SbcCD ATPase subunit
MKDLETQIRRCKTGIEVEIVTVEAKKLTSEERNNLPDSDFAYIEPGGKKVDGKTEPRSLRKFPIQDAAHVRSALSYLGKSDLSPEAKKSALKKIKIAAKKFGVTVSDSDAKSKKEWDKIDKKELKKDTPKEKKEHEQDAIDNDEREIKDLKKDVKFDKKNKKKDSKAASDKERQERLERDEDGQDKRELDSETLRERLKHHEDAVKNLKKEIEQLQKDEKEDKKDVKRESEGASDKQKAARDKFKEMIQKKKGDTKDSDEDTDDKKDDKKGEKKKEAKGHYNDKGQYVPYEGPEPNPAVQYLPKGQKPVEIDKAKDEGDKYIPYEGQEPKDQVQYAPVPQEEKFQHQSYMSECMGNTALHTDTEGLDESRSYMACAIAYDKKYQTSYAPCGPMGCIY